MHSFATYPPYKKVSIFTVRILRAWNPLLTKNTLHEKILRVLKKWECTSGTNYHIGIPDYRSHCTGYYIQ